LPKEFAMSNQNHLVTYTPFFNLSDNVAQSHNTTWGELLPMLTTHVVTTNEKALLPCINGYQYLLKGDPAEAMGLRKDGKPNKNFSPIGVRRLRENLIAMSLFIADFDGRIQLSDVQSIFGQFEYACYTSFNHQRTDIEKKQSAVDKFRTVVPLATPMPITKFRELRTAMHHWLDGDGHRISDPVTFSIGQIYLLPAVREEDQSKAVAWHNEGELMDWTMFEAIKSTMPVSSPIVHNASGTRPNGFVLKPDDMLQTFNGSIAVHSIDRKISGVLCPFHADTKPSEFAGITNNGTPFLQCKKCGRVYMTRTKEDPILTGIKKIADAKRRRADLETK
jgi:hypothetical protein